MKESIFSKLGRMRAGARREECSSRAINETFSSALDEAIMAADGLLAKAEELGRLGRSAELIACYDDLIDRFGTAAELLLRERVVKALHSKGAWLFELSRSDSQSLSKYWAHQTGLIAEAFAVCDDLVVRFGTATELPLRERVAETLCEKQERLAQLGYPEEAVAVCDDIITRFGAAPEWQLRKSVAHALLSKTVRLDGIEQIALFDKVVARFEAAPHPGLSEQVAEALLKKGAALAKLDRNEEAVANYDAMIARFAAAPEPRLRDLVADAFSSRYEAWQVGKPELFPARDLYAIRKSEVSTICHLGLLTAQPLAGSPPPDRVFGFARTARIRFKATHPCHESKHLLAFCEHLAAEPRPVILVVEVVDGPADKIIGFHASKGANAGTAPGCVGLLANHGVSDARSLETLVRDFLVSADSISPWRDRCYLVEFGVPVRVADMTVEPNDVVVVDGAGAVAISPKKAKGYDRALARLASSDRMSY